jgi:DNA-binding SARP family transcriptional activator
MIHLRTLGTLEFKGGDPDAMRSILAQPKRVALLVYLAIAQPRGFHRRDTLLPLFWPDADSEHAHSALRQATFALRRSLGAGSIESRGDSDLGLDWSAISCDAAAFERALDAGDAEDALDLYRGILLPGFYVAGAAFERWLETERWRLHHRAIGAAKSLLQRAEASGRTAIAMQWARHLTSLSPDDEGAVSRLIGLLGVAGERTEARRVYERFRRLLAEDFQLDPSPELEGQMRRISRSREPSITPSGRARNRSR